MKETIEIEGVLTGGVACGQYPQMLAKITLSRFQVEDALKRLNEPEFEAGDIVERRHTKGRFLVISGWLNNQLERPPTQVAPLLTGQYRITDGTFTYVVHATFLEKVGAL